MKVERDSSLPVAVELDASLNALLEAAHQQPLEQRLGLKTARLLERLGLAGAPAVEVRVGSFARLLRVRAHGVLQPYSPELMKRVWRALAPEPLRNLPDAVRGRRQTRFPDEWLKQYVAGIAPSVEADWALALEYVSELVVEIIRQRPSCLVGPAQAAGYSREDALLSAGISPDVLMPVLKSLLDLGVSIKDKEAILEEISHTAALGRPAEDSAETAFARLRSNRIGIHLHPKYGDSLLRSESTLDSQDIYASGSATNVAGQLRAAQEALYYEMGLVLPDIVWLQAPETSDGMIAIEVNDHLHVPQPGLKTGDLLINAPPAQLKLLGIEGESCIHPVNGKECTVVAATHRINAENAGFKVWSPLEFLGLVLYAEVSRLAESVLSIEDVEGHLAELDSSFPELVRAATARFSLEDLTRVLRGLLRERVSIRNLRGILEQLLRYDTVRVDSKANIVLDDRLPVSEDAATDTWMNYRDFVRVGLKDQLCAKYSAGWDTFIAYLVAPTLEARAEAVLPRLGAGGSEIVFDEGLHELLCDSAWKQARSVSPTTQTAVILTVTSARTAIREMISGELPDLPVVAYSELRPELTVQPIARIG